MIVDFIQSFRQSDYAIHKPQIGLQGATRTDIREVYEDHGQTLKVSVPESDRNSLIDDTEFDRLQMDRFLNIEFTRNALSPHQRPIDSFTVSCTGLLFAKPQVG